MSPKQHKYWRGILLYSICEFLEVDKQDYDKASRRLHNAFKTMFEVRSFKDLSSKEFEKIAGTVRMLFAREFQWIIPDASDEGINLQEISMSDFLKIKMK